MSRRAVIVVNQPRRQVTVVGDPAKPKTVIVRGAQRRTVAVQGAYIPRADIGTNIISGIQVELSNIQPDDVLAYNGTRFINRAQVALTDGGNF